MRGAAPVVGGAPIVDRGSPISERFGIPDHSPQHAPDHAQQNPTPQGSWGQSTDGGEWPAAPAPSYGGGGGSYSYSPVAVDPRKSLKVAIVLAIVLGPLGLFYVSFLNGVAALFLVVPVARQMAFAAAFALGGRVDLVLLAVLSTWCITVPWAVIGVRWRNAKLDRR